jgi:hypothetical protein
VIMASSIDVRPAHGSARRHSEIPGAVPGHHAIIFTQ